MARIKQFSDRPLRKGGTFLELGRWRKGAPKLKDAYAKELDYFRFEPTPNPLYNTDALQAAMTSAYGEQPSVLDNVAFIADDPETVFSSSFEKWAETKKGVKQIRQRCDGTNINFRFEKRGEDKEVCIRTPTPCTHQCDCLPTGRLQFWLPEFTHRTGIIGSFLLVTHSKEDIEHITEVLDNTHALAGRLMGLLFSLVRYPKMVTTPAGIPTQKYPVKLAWSNSTAQHVALNAGNQLALPAPIEINEPLVVTPERQWNTEEMRTFWQHWTAKGYQAEKILSALQVQQLGQWQHSYAAAMQRMENHQ